MRGSDYVVKRIALRDPDRLHRDHPQLRALPRPLRRRGLGAALQAVQQGVQGGAAPRPRARPVEVGAVQALPGRISPTAISASRCRPRSPSRGELVGADQELAADDRARDALRDRLRHLVGVVAAWRRGTFADKGSLYTALGFYSMPTQWLGLMLIFFVASAVGLPTSGIKTPTLGLFTDASTWDIFVDRLRHMILPALTLGPRPLRRLRADRALGDARDARRGLRPDGAGEGAEELDDRAQARAAQRDAADHHARRAVARLHHRRRRSRSSTSSPTRGSGC